MVIEGDGDRMHDREAKWGLRDCPRVSNMREVGTLRR
jgi:hypothetical protein